MEHDIDRFQHRLTTRGTHTKIGQATKVSQDVNSSIDEQVRSHAPWGISCGKAPEVKCGFCTIGGGVEELGKESTDAAVN